MGISRLDHVAIPVIDMGPMEAFYRSLGFRIDDELAPLRISVCAGDMKLNLHYPDLWRSDFELRGPGAEPGCGDVCMVWDGTEAELDTFLEGVDTIEGPVTRTGGKDQGSATGTSRYIRDPEFNLLEFIIY